MTIKTRGYRPTDGPTDIAIYRATNAAIDIINANFVHDDMTCGVWLRSSSNSG